MAEGAEVSAERRSPLEATYQSLGARFASVRGARLPERFSDVADECRAVRTAAGVVDRSDRIPLTASGPDAKAFLHRMLSNDVARLAAGQGCYATLLNPQGQMLADLYALQMEDHLLVETDVAAAVRAREWLEKYIIADDVTLTDRAAQMAALDVAGPQAAKLLAAAGAAALPGAELNHAWTKLGDAAALVLRVDETGEEGYRLIFVVEYAQNLWDALMATRAAVAWKPVGHAAWNVLRTEAGLPWYGADMDERTLPPEAALEARAISYNKGCYLGQEIIERIRSRGHVNRRLAGFQVSGALPTAGAKLLGEGKEVGALTTVVESPTLGRGIALGILRREFLAAGTKLEVEGGGAAEVVELPFYRRTR
jgi:glycine cleavage system T protein